MKRKSTREDAEAALRNARKAAKRGDLPGAERWSKTAERLAAAATTLADAPAPAEAWQTDEDVRQEVRRRLQRFVEVDLEIQAWEAERDAYEEAVRLAREIGAPDPPPLRMCPAGPEDLERIARYGMDENGAPLPAPHC